MGALAGFAGGWTDAVLMRLAEFFQTLPRFVLALIVIALFGPGIGKVIAVIAILSWPQTARLVRASFATLRRAGFVDAARLGGMPGITIMLREILPNAAGPIIVLGRWMSPPRSCWRLGWGFSALATRTCPPGAAC